MRKRFLADAAFGGAMVLGWCGYRKARVLWGDFREEYEVRRREEITTYPGKFTVSRAAMAAAMRGTNNVQPERETVDA